LDRDQPAHGERRLLAGAGQHPHAVVGQRHASGSAGCNNFNGGFTVDGQQLTFGPLATTRKACADPAIGQQETDYLAALASTRTFSSTSSMLTLLADDGTITVTLARATTSTSTPPTTT
jgi:heat shock protein HslJ